jgi:hypothetical protein
LGGCLSRFDAAKKLGSVLQWLVGVGVGSGSELAVALELELRRFLGAVFVGLVLTPRPRLTSNHSPVVWGRLDLPGYFDCRGLVESAFSPVGLAAQGWIAAGDYFGTEFGCGFVVVAVSEFVVAVMAVVAIETLSVFVVEVATVFAIVVAIEALIEVATVAKIVVCGCRFAALQAWWSAVLVRLLLQSWLVELEQRLFSADYPPSSYSK